MLTRPGSAPGGGRGALGDLISGVVGTGPGSESGRGAGLSGLTAPLSVGLSRPRPKPVGHRTSPGRAGWTPTEKHSRAQRDARSRLRPALALGQASRSERTRIGRTGSRRRPWASYDRFRWKGSGIWVSARLLLRAIPLEHASECYAHVNVVMPGRPQGRPGKFQLLALHGRDSDRADTRMRERSVHRIDWFDSPERPNPRAPTSFSGCEWPGGSRASPCWGNNMRGARHGRVEWILGPGGYQAELSN